MSKQNCQRVQKKPPTSQAEGPSKMEFQAAAEGTRRGKLHRYFFAFLGDAIAVVSDVNGIELKVDAARLGLPDVEPGGEVSGEVLIQARPMLNDGAATVAQRGS